MKPTITFFALCFSSILFGQTVTIKGKIENPNNPYLILRTSYNVLVDSMVLDANNEVSTSVKFKEGNYELFDGEEFFSLYLKPNFRLSFTFDASQFDETFHFEGIGAEVNNYSAQAYLLNEGLGKYDYYAYLYKLDEARFLYVVDSVFQLKMNLLNTYKKMDKDLFELKRLELVYGKDHKLYSYQKGYRYFGGNKDFVVSKNFPNPFKNFDPKRKDLVIHSSYGNLLADYVNSKAVEIRANDTSLDYYMATLLAIEQNLSVPKVREAAIQYQGERFFIHSKSRIEVYEKMRALSTDSSFRNRVQTQYTIMTKIDPGKMSPPFTFTDTTGSSVSLKNFAGKYVYVDIWATWCAPCLMEIPRHKILVEKYKGQNIVFVSIAKNDDKERWRNAIKKHGLLGIHLFAEDSNAAFFNAYMVDGIPRYILIAPDGSIVNSDAARPSNNALFEQLDGLLK